MTIMENASDYNNIEKIVALQNLDELNHYAATSINRCLSITGIINSKMILTYL